MSGDKTYVSRSAKLSAIRRQRQTAKTFPPPNRCRLRDIRDSARATLCIDQPTTSHARNTTPTTVRWHIHRTHKSHHCFFVLFFYYLAGPTGKLTCTPAGGAPAAAAGTFGMVAAADGAERARPADGSPDRVPGTSVDVAPDVAAAGIDRARRRRPPADGSRVGVLLPPPEEGPCCLAVAGVCVLRSDGCAGGCDPRGARSARETRARGQTPAPEFWVRPAGWVRAAPRASPLEFRTSPESC